MLNIDDMVWSHLNGLTEEIVRAELTKHGFEDMGPMQTVGRDKFSEWRDFLWKYDVSTWKPCDDDRAFPDTHYSNNLLDVLEFRAYDLRDIISKYIEEHKHDIKLRISDSEPKALTAADVFARKKMEIEKAQKKIEELQDEIERLEGQIAFHGRLKSLGWLINE